MKAGIKEYHNRPYDLQYNATYTQKDRSMTIVTTSDGQRIELQPCPAWCTEEHHFAIGVPVEHSDGFHHYSRPTRIETSQVVDYHKGKFGAIEVSLMSWVCPLDAEPGPTKIDLKIDSGLELTPTDARRVAEVLLNFSERILGSGSN